MPRQERAEQTRKAILDAAASRFDAVGFLGASLADILAEAGVTKGALYFHFRAKEDLADALIEEQFGLIGDEPAVEIPPEGVGLQTVIDWSHDLAVALQNDVRVRAGIRLVIEQGSFLSPASTAYKRWTDATHGILLAAEAAGDLREDVNAYELAQFIVASFTGIQLNSQVLTGRADLTDRVTFMWTILLAAVVPPRRLHKFTATRAVAESDAPGDS